MMTTMKPATGAEERSLRLPFEGRTQAGQLLAQAMRGAYAGRNDTLVLALPRGGVPVAFEIVKAIGAPLDLMIVRKLGTPGQPELAMGAIAAGVQLLNRDIVESMGISPAAIEAVARRERKELERRQRAYRGDRPEPEFKNRCVMLVDDGLATGATMRTAVKALREHAPASVVVAVPVAPPSTVELLRGEADEVVCLATPEPFWAIGQWYREFPQVSDDEVTELLQRAWERSCG